MPYNTFSIFMIRYLIGGKLYVLNSFASKNDVSSNMSPEIIIEGRFKPDSSDNNCLYT